MSADIKVNYAVLEQASLDMVQSGKDIEARLDQLTNELRPLSEQWFGDAREAFRDESAKWNSAIEDMLVHLREADQKLRAAIQAFRDSDARGAAMMRG